MPPARTLAELMREVGIEPSGHALYTESIDRPIPRRDAYVPPPRAPQLSQRQQQQSFDQLSQRQSIQGDIGRREAYDPGIDPNTGMTQAQEALLYNLELTGVPSLFRSYNSFQEGRPLEGAGHGALGLLGTLGTASMAAMPARRTAAQMGRLPLNGALEPPTRLPVNPTREMGYTPQGGLLPIRPSEPFRTSLNGGSDDLLAAARQRPDAGVAGAEQMPRSAALEGEVLGPAGRDLQAPARAAEDPLDNFTAFREEVADASRRTRGVIEAIDIILGQRLATPDELTMMAPQAARFHLQRVGGDPVMAAASLRDSIAWQRSRLGGFTEGTTQHTSALNDLGQAEAALRMLEGPRQLPAPRFPDGGARGPTEAPTASPGPKPTDPKNQTPPRKRGFPFGRAR